MVITWICSFKLKKLVGNVGSSLAKSCPQMISLPGAWPFKMN